MIDPKLKEYAANPRQAEIVQAVIEAGGIRPAARALGIHHSTVQGALGAVEAAARRAGHQAPKGAAPEPRTLDDDVIRHRSQSSSVQDKARLKEALARIATLQDRLRDYEWAANASLKPADWTLALSPKGKSECMPHLFTSDHQVGEVIRSEETDHAYGYDVAAFRTRYRLLIATTVDICFNHERQRSYPGMIYGRGGDAISGAIHEELAQTDQLTPIEAVEVCFEEEAAGIRKLRDAFGRVEVKETEEGGNHGRDTHKPHSKRASGHSLERLISYLLRREFGGDPRVSFQTSKSPDVHYSIYGRRIVQTHGDKIGSRGGQGFIGAEATILRGAQKVSLEFQARGLGVDEVHMGHFHIARDFGWVLSNGSLPGYSEFAKNNRMRPEPPCQWLSFYGPKYGAFDRRRIYLETSSPEMLAA